MAKLLSDPATTAIQASLANGDIIVPASVGSARNQSGNVQLKSCVSSVGPPQLVASGVQIVDSLEEADLVGGS